MNKNTEERGFYAWILRHVNAPYAQQLFFLLFAFEVILLVPLDPILAFFVTHRRDDAYRFAAIATIGSIIGAGLGYLFGDLLWEAVGSKIIDWMVTQARFDAFVSFYQDNYKTALFVGALFPFPFKLLTISAGFCGLPVATFLSVIGCARALRFFTICYVSRRWGSVIQLFVKRYSDHLLLLLAIILVLVLGCYMVFFR